MQRIGNYIFFYFARLKHQGNWSLVDFHFTIAKYRITILRIVGYSE